MSRSGGSSVYTATNSCHALFVCTTSATSPPVTLAPDRCHAGCAGFAFINADSTTDVCAVEAVKLGDLDPEAVRAGLSEYQAKLGSLQARICIQSMQAHYVHMWQLCSVPSFCCGGTSAVWQ